MEWREVVNGSASLEPAHSLTFYARVRQNNKSGFLSKSKNPTRMRN